MDMFENINLIDIQQRATEWFLSSVLTLGFGTQLALIIGSFFLGFILKNLIKPRLNDRINKLSIPYRLTEILYSALKLTFPFIVMILVTIGAKIIGPTGFGFPNSFAIGTAKLLLAWIFIRLAAQIKRFRAKGVDLFQRLTLRRRADQQRHIAGGVQFCCQLAIRLSRPALFRAVR